ncbi:MAG: hypothetical protein MK010_08910 [Erythrobacter sp.]|nr:hypothetical protein [Erythrobacter sp.]
MERQQQSNWCWTAAATSVGNYLSPGAGFAQCAIASICLGTNDCCVAPSSCNRPGRLDTALKAVGRFHRIWAARLSFHQTAREIKADRPVGVRVQWNGGGGHFVMLTEYFNVVGAIVVDDPHYGRSIMRFASFPARHQTGGS